MTDSDPEPVGGLHRFAEDGRVILDAMAGRVCGLGLGDHVVTRAIAGAASEYLGDACDHDAECERSVEADRVAAAVQAWIATFDDRPSPIDLTCVSLHDSAAAAIENVTWRLRCQSPPGRYRIITAAGSDHGDRSTLCRTLSGLTDRHADFGPLIAGIHYVPAGDIAALKSAVDDSVAAVWLSPIDGHNACRPLDKRYLVAVREHCDAHGVALLIDESQWVPGGGGGPFVFCDIAPIRADAIVLAAGLMGGMPGGIVLAGDSVPGSIAQTRGRNQAAGTDARSSTAGDVVAWNQPGSRLACGVSAAVLRGLTALPASTRAGVGALADALARRIETFPFIRDVNVTGGTIGIATDLPAAELVAAAARCDLVVAAAGEYGIRLQPPINISPQDATAVIDALVAAMESIARQGIEIH